MPYTIDDESVGSVSYRYNALVGQKLSYARFFQVQLDTVEPEHFNAGVTQYAAFQEAVIFELVNTLRAFLSEIADNYGVDPACSDAKALSLKLALQGIVSPEVEEILLSLSGDGWISALMTRHSENCSGTVFAKAKESTVQPLHFLQGEQTNRQPDTARVERGRKRLLALLVPDEDQGCGRDAIQQRIIGGDAVR